MAKISVILPIYEAEANLSGTISSILVQTYYDFEIICINDSTMDNCVSIVKRFQQSDPRVKLVHHETHRGTGSAQNTGLRHSTGDFIKFLEAGDLLAPSALEDLLFAIDTTGADWSLSAFEELDRGSASLTHPFYSNTSANASANGLLRIVKIHPDPLVILDIWPYAWLGLWRRTTINSANAAFYEPSQDDDYNFFFAYAFASASLTYVNRPLYLLGPNKKKSITRQPNRLLEVFDIIERNKHFERNLTPDTAKRASVLWMTRLLAQNSPTFEATAPQAEEYFKRSAELLRIFPTEFVKSNRDTTVSDKELDRLLGIESKNPDPGCESAAVDNPFNESVDITHISAMDSQIQSAVTEQETTTSKLAPLKRAMSDLPNASTSQAKGGALGFAVRPMLQFGTKLFNRLSSGATAEIGYRIRTSTQQTRDQVNRTEKQIIKRIEGVVSEVGHATEAAREAAVTVREAAVAAAQNFTVAAQNSEITERSNAAVRANLIALQSKIEHLSQTVQTSITGTKDGNHPSGVPFVVPEYFAGKVWPWADLFKRAYWKDPSASEERLEALKANLDPHSQLQIQWFWDLCTKKLPPAEYSEEDGYLLRKDLSFRNHDLREQRKILRIIENEVDRYSLSSSSLYKVSTFYYHHGLRWIEPELKRYVVGHDVLCSGISSDTLRLAFKEYRFSSITDAETRSVILKEPSVQGSPVVETHGAVMQTIDAFVSAEALSPRFILIKATGPVLPMLHSAIGTVRKLRPIMVISVHNTPEDFLDIKPLIEELGLGYRFRIEHHNPFDPVDETMLVCLPSMPH